MFLSAPLLGQTNATLGQTASTLGQGTAPSLGQSNILGIRSTVLGQNMFLSTPPLHPTSNEVGFGQKTVSIKKFIYFLYVKRNNGSMEVIYINLLLLLLMSISSLSFSICYLHIQSSLTTPQPVQAAQTDGTSNTNFGQTSAGNLKLILFCLCSFLGCNCHLNSTYLMCKSEACWQVSQMFLVRVPLVNCKLHVFYALYFGLICYFDIVGKPKLIWK